MHRTSRRSGSSSSSSGRLDHIQVDPNLEPKLARATHSRRRSSLWQGLKQFSTTFSTRSSSCQFRLLITCVTLIAVAAGRPADGQQLQQAPQLPTVIVRGFLNYRTTVDGTVLLFTPDAGQSQPAASAAVQPAAKTSQVARLEPTSSAPHPRRTLVYTETLAHAIEPTSVYLAPEQPQTVHLMDRHSNRQQQQPAEPPLAIGADSLSNNEPAQPNEWRPIQATPPLKPTQTSSTLATRPNQDQQEISSANQPTKPSVQADDIAETSQPAKLAKETNDTPTVPKQPEPETTRAATRFRRPSLGFNGQGLRPRVPGTDGAVSPSLQARARPTESNDSNPSPPNSINGIRRPGLASSSAQSSPARSQIALSSELAPPTNVSSAFQNRLSNASTRLRNRFKHRQPNSIVATTQSPASGSPVVVASGSSSSSGGGGDGSELKERNSLVAPESLLDVASSIEQPTSAARSLALTPQSNREHLSSSGPTVGSDEAMAPLASSLQAQSNSPTEVTSSLEAANNQQDQPETVIVPVVASSVGEPDPLTGLGAPISVEQQAGTASLSRAGEQQPARGALSEADSGPRVISGQLLSDSLSSGPLNLDNIFLGDQPVASQTSMENQAPSEPAPSHTARAASSQLHRPMKAHNSTNFNGKLNGWLGQHHNKFVPRPSLKPGDHHSNLSYQLASNLQQLAPTPVPFANQSVALSSQYEPINSNNNNNNSSQADASSVSALALPVNGTNSESASGGNSSLSELQLTADQLNMQTVTRTYSTILETTRTRIVPMQVDSSTGIFTITEDFLMTKMMTAYQTLPASAVFLLADQQLSTRAPYEVFDSSSSSRESAESKQKAESVPVAPAIVSSPSAPIETQEQPISLDDSPKTANNWLHDFSNLDAGSANPLTNDFSSSTSANQQDQQQQAMLALLEQRAREANLAPNFSPLMGPGGEQLDQLASQLNPTSLFADGAINIPDLNNPLVLAAAIQNPQLAAVILAAQQLKLKRQQQLQQKPQQQLQLQNQFNQLQPSFSTSFSTTIRPSTYTARDTMYTTRLVSFRDGRTVRTRTVSEPGSVVEQVLTTMVTETIPITIAIKPTALIGLGPAATQLPGGGGGLSTGALSAQSNQATINNALFATQLANILSRRQQQQQQQLQTSFQSPSLGGLAQGLSQAASATPQQLLALQQYIGQQQKRQQQAQQSSSQLQAQQQQFQPNFQQLLQSMDSSNGVGGGGGSSTNSSTSQQVSRKVGANSPQNPAASGQSAQHQATPSLQQAPKSVVSSLAPMNVLSGPITTTLTSIQTKTYTVHNAFKTIFRTITSTILIPTVLNAGSTLMPTFG